MKRLSTVLAMAVCLGGSVCAVWADDKIPPPPLVQLKSYCYAFALDQKTGALLGLDPSARTATLYPKSYLEGKGTEVTGPVPLPGAPLFARYKRLGEKAFFLVGILNEPAIGMLDTETLELVKVVPLPGIGMVALSTSADADDPYVYYVVADQNRNTAVGRVDLRTTRVDGSIGVQGDVGDVVVSADGRRLCVRSRRSDRLTSYRDSGGSGGPASWQEQTTVNLTGALLVDPDGRYVAAGQNIRTADLSGLVWHLDYVPVSFFPERPILVGLAERQLVLASSNTFVVREQVTLPTEFWGGVSRRFRPGLAVVGGLDEYTFLPRFFADATNHRVVGACSNHVFIQSLDAMNIPPEPRMVVRVDPPSQAIVGRELNIPFRVPDKACGVELRESPEGMKIDREALTWTPDESQVGPVRFTLRISQGTVERLQTYELQIYRDNHDIGFVPLDIAFNADGSTAVAWTGDPKRAADGYSRLVLLDLKQRKTLAVRDLTYTVGLAAVDGKRVYVVPAQADRIEALGLNDLSLQTFSFTSVPVSRLTPVSSGILLASARDVNLTYSLPDLKLRETAFSRTLPGQKGLRDHDCVRHFGNGWYGAGCLFGADPDKPAMLVEPLGLCSLRRQNAPRFPVPVPWSRTITQGVLVTSTGQRVALLDKGSTIFLDDYPVAVTATSSVSPGRQVSVNLVFRQLVTGEPVRTISLARDLPCASFGCDYDHPPGPLNLGAFGSTVYVRLGDRLFSYTLDRESLARFPYPFELQPLKEVPKLSPDKPTEIPSRIRGGAPPFAFALKDGQPGVSIDPETGVVTVDGPSLSPKALATVTNQLWSKLSRTVSSGQAVDADAAVAEWVRANSGPVTLLVAGPKTVAVLVPVSVSATDGMQQVAALNYQVVVEVSTDQVRDQLAKLIREAQEKEKTRQNSRPGPSAGTGA